MSIIKVVETAHIWINAKIPIRKTVYFLGIPVYSKRFTEGSTMEGKWVLKSKNGSATSKEPKPYAVSNGS